MAQATSIGARAAAAVNLERQIGSVLRRAADEIAHAESFDEEQRSEIYSILTALESDNRLHAAAADALSKAEA